jgi:hypothetical protein
MTIGKYINKQWYMINRIDAAKSIMGIYDVHMCNELTNEIKKSIDCIFDYEMSKEKRRLNPVKII